MRVLGLDPGITGGLALYDGSTIDVIATPTRKVPVKGKRDKSEYDIDSIVEWIRSRSPDVIWLEDVHSMPRQGVASTFFFFFFGKGFGILIGVCHGIGIRLNYVRPQVWKGYFSIGAEKSSSLTLARQLFPANAAKDFKLKKQDGLAEAALIAKYGFDHCST